MKQGEQEAKMILVRKGVALDDNYHDDNSRLCLISSIWTKSVFLKSPTHYITMQS